MAEESARALFYLEDDENERLWDSLRRLTRDLLRRIKRRLFSQQLLLDIEEVALAVAESARNLHDRYALQQRASAQPTRLADGRDVDFSELQ